MIFREEKAALVFLTRFQLIVVVSQPASSCLASFTLLSRTSFFFWCHRQSWDNTSCSPRRKPTGTGFISSFLGRFYFSTRSVGCRGLMGLGLRLQARPQLRCSRRAAVLDLMKDKRWFLPVAAPLVSVCPPFRSIRSSLSALYLLRSVPVLVGWGCVQGTGGCLRRWQTSAWPLGPLGARPRCFGSGQACSISCQV